MPLVRKVLHAQLLAMTSLSATMVDAVSDAASNRPDLVICQTFVNPALCFMFPARVVLISIGVGSHSTWFCVCGQKNASLLPSHIHGFRFSLLALSLFVCITSVSISRHDFSLICAL